MAIDELTEQLPPELRLDFLLFHATEHAALSGLMGQYPDKAVRSMIDYLAQARLLCDGNQKLLLSYLTRACTIVRIAQRGVAARTLYNQIDLKASGGQKAFQDFGNEKLEQDLECTAIATELLAGYKIR